MQTQETPIDTAALPVTDGPEPALVAERDWSELTRLFKDANEEVRKALETMSGERLNDNYSFLFQIMNFAEPRFCAGHTASCCNVEAHSLPALLAGIAAHKPVDAKAARIAELEAELAKLKGGVK